MPSASKPLPSFMSRQVANARRFYLSGRRSADCTLEVISGGWERCTPDYLNEREGFPLLTIEFVAGGHGLLTMGGKTHALSRGTVFSYASGVAHTIATDTKTPLSKYFVNFRGSHALTLMRKAKLSPGRCHTTLMPEEVQSVFEHIIIAGQRGTDTTGRIATLYLEILLLKLGESPPTATGTSQRAFETFSRCLAHLTENYTTIRTLEEVADSCHVAPHYLSRLFARFAKESPYRFLMRLKMNHAATLLVEQRLLVREVADTLGMDPFLFSRSFKKIHGVSPQAFSHASSNA